MTLDALKQEIIDDIAAEVSVTDADKYNETLLASKVGAAIHEVKRARHYPAGYSEEMVEKDMADFYSNIRNIAMYDYNQIGAEGQTQYSADGASIHYVDRNKLFAGIIPIGRVV